MCRWNAYFGQPVAIDELLVKTDHGLIIQSGADEQRPFQPRWP